MAFKERELSTRELVLRLHDKLNKGLKYDPKLGVYKLVWTQRQLRQIRRQSLKLFRGLKVE